jgi:hypothetical protein
VNVHIKMAAGRNLLNEFFPNNGTVSQGMMNKAI